MTMRTLRMVPARSGLTLLEVIVAMAIFLISVIAILQLVLLGGERAMDVRLQTRTSMRCQAKLAEVMAGFTPLSSGGGYTNFDEDFDKDLQWRMEATESVPGLWDVKIWVKADLASGKTVESSLFQMVLDPSIRGTTFDQPLPAPTGN